MGNASIYRFQRRYLGEGYLPIPRNIAKQFGILNSNGTTAGSDEHGKNLFRCKSADGEFSGILKAQGCNTAGDIYAKQFAGDTCVEGVVHL